MLGDIFSLVLCDFHTVKWCKESIDMVHIKWTLWILIYVVCTKFVFCRKLILKALFRFNGTSKPSLTIALKILKTIEKPLIPMVGPSKNIQWWWSNVVKTIEKPLKSMVAWKKTLTIPSLWKIDHRSGLSLNNSFLGNPPEQQRPLGGRSRSWRSVMVIVVLITLGDNHDSDLICLLWSMSCLWCLSLCSHKRWWTHSSRSSRREFRRLL